jgi:hypothetical protein
MCNGCAALVLPTIAVSNIYGMWFEIQQCRQGFEAHRLAHSDLGLLDLPLPGMSYKELRKTKEPITRPSSCAGPPPVEQPTLQDPIAWGPPFTPYIEPQLTQPQPYEVPRGDVPSNDDDNEPMDSPVDSSATNILPYHPGGTGDDPMMLAALNVLGSKGPKGVTCTSWGTGSGVGHKIFCMPRGLLN